MLALQSVQAGDIYGDAYHPKPR
ncbi:protein of unknown function [Cupriavidus neocaledonicus]|uniref:Uncharacterized protein n=1 Tax=Cupriavidus neocaledonicus TaxID=1040979 RepID=A0A375H8U7_9BURK|nr:hypothetical protein CBM2605_A140121 [Cupriavidus neocaledonicus]SPD46630.1 protein of unknown function [Cupriavidus neocaledonicus]